MSERDIGMEALVELNTQVNQQVQKTFNGIVMRELRELDLRLQAVNNLLESVINEVQEIKNG